MDSAFGILQMSFKKINSRYELLKTFNCCHLPLRYTHPCLSLTISNSVVSLQRTLTIPYEKRDILWTAPNDAIWKKTRYLVIRPQCVKSLFETTGRVGRSRTTNLEQPTQTRKAWKLQEKQRLYQRTGLCSVFTYCVLCVLCVAVSIFVHLDVWYNDELCPFHYFDICLSIS